MFKKKKRNKRLILETQNEKFTKSKILLETQLLKINKNDILNDFTNEIKPQNRKKELDFNALKDTICEIEVQLKTKDFFKEAENL